MPNRLTGRTGRPSPPAIGLSLAMLLCLLGSSPVLAQDNPISRATAIDGDTINLHGEPIVCSPTDAIDVLLRSGLDCITLEDYLVWPARSDQKEETSLSDRPV